MTLRTVIQSVELLFIKKYLEDPRFRYNTYPCATDSVSVGWQFVRNNPQKLRFKDMTGCVHQRRRFVRGLLYGCQVGRLDRTAILSLLRNGQSYAYRHTRKSPLEYEISLFIAPLSRLLMQRILSVLFTLIYIGLKTHANLSEGCHEHSGRRCHLHDFCVTSDAGNRSQAAHLGRVLGYHWYSDMVFISPHQ